MMKRTVLLLAAAVAILGACKKTQVDESNKPSAAWETNPSFDLMEIGVNMDGKVNLTVPEGVESLVVRVTEIPVDLRGIVKKEISISGNKNDLIMDLVSDDHIATAFVGFVSPRQVSGAKNVTLNFAPMLNKIAEGQLLNNDDRFTFELTLLDAAENKLSKTIRFRWTSAPELTFLPNRGTPVIYLEETESYNFDSDQLVIKAPGRIENITISFSGEEADPAILAHIKGFTQSNVIDLVKDEKVAKAMGLISSASSFQEKTEATLSLSSLLLSLSLQSTDSHRTTMTVTVTDVLGKSTSDFRTLASANLGK